jgi:hypothetical protein
MARRALTRELYDSLVIAFREAPGNASFAARRALCERRMAKRGWEIGWPQYPWAKPIKRVLENEKIDAMAQARMATVRAQEAAEAERDAARQEAIDAKKQEHQMLKAARGDVLAALVLAAELVPSMRAVAQAVAAACRSPGNGPDGKPLPPAIPAPAAMGLLTRHATLIQKAVGAAEAVIQLSRLERGASTVNVGLSAPDEDLSMEDALEELEAIEEVLRTAKPGALRALPGGKTGT